MIHLVMALSYSPSSHPLDEFLSLSRPSKIQLLEIGDQYTARFAALGTPIDMQPLARRTSRSVSGFNVMRLLTRRT